MTGEWPDANEQTIRETALPSEMAIEGPPTGMDDTAADPFATDHPHPATGTSNPTAPPLTTDPRTPIPGFNGSSYGSTAVIIEPGNVIFGKYEVLERLGRGGMGEVWLVKDIELDVKRALKMITQGTAFNPEARARFRREARAMARFTHTNVVAVHDSRLDHQDVAYIVMEYVAGQSLEKIIRPGHPMSVDWTLLVLTQLCDALQEAHSQGIIHRDLKPSNLILVDTASKRDLLKVLDFGIAKILQTEDVPQDARTIDGAFMGTPPYASPEQASGHAVPLSDIYSVGVILYEFLTGSRPFSGRPAFIIASTMFTDPPPFADVNAEAHVPPEVERVVMRCLAKKPEDRPQSASELLEEFRAAVPTVEYVADVQQTPPSPTTLTATPKPTRRISWIAAAAVGLAASCVALALLVPRHSKPGPKLVSPSQPAVTPTRTTRELQIISKDRAFTLSKGGFYLPNGYDPAINTEAASDGWPREIVRKVDGVKFARIPGGKFRMGARDKPDADRSDAEPANQPAREVTLPGFYIQKNEVTNGELLAYVKKFGDQFTNPSADATWRTWYTKACEPPLNPELAAKHPARQVSWGLAADFAKKNGGRLPSEAEWEFAARSGESARVLVWDFDKDGASSVSDLANLDQADARNGLWTAEVGSYPLDRTRQGVMDMAGNVREWTRDPWIDYDKLPPGGPPPAPEKPSPDTEMVVRGGSFNLDSDSRFMTHRGKKLRLSDEVPYDVGFRIVIECPE